MLTNERFLILLKEYENGSISPENQALLFEAIESGRFQRVLEEEIDRQLHNKIMEGGGLSPERSANIIQNILRSTRQNKAGFPRPFTRSGTFRYMAAALVIAVSVSIYFLYQPDKHGFDLPVPPGSNLKHYANGTGKTVSISMDDGTSVTLMPGSTLHYPLHFPSMKREVSLEGEAFFEVSKDVSRPFLVYNRHIVTRVLGTSFTVKAKDSSHVEVSVRSGKVEVFEHHGTTEEQQVAATNRMIVPANHRAIYDEKSRQFVSALIEEPLPVTAGSEKTDTAAANRVFEETPLRSVLPDLAKTYGVEISVENDKINNCLFTGDLNQQNLYTRLEVICQAVQAHFEISGDRILITGDGCR